MQGVAEKPRARFRFQQSEEQVVDETFSAQEASELTGESVWVIQKWCREGKVKNARKVRGKWRIPKSELVVDE